MSVVTSEIEIEQKPSITFRVAREVEKYPSFMPNVVSVEVLERREDGYSKVRWVARVQVASLDKQIKWVEEEYWNESELSSRFSLLEGDYTHYRGEWKFIPTERGTHVSLTVDYDLGLPLIGPLIGKLLDKLMKDNLDGMLKAIKERAESTPSS